MGEKKEKTPKSKIEIRTRKPEKRGIFANLGSDRSKNDHPLREILNFPLETEKQSDTISKSQDSGYPLSSSLDIQNQNTGQPNLIHTDSQNQVSGNPEYQNLDSQPVITLDIQELSGYPIVSTTDSQNTLPGYPTETTSDSPTIRNGAPEELILDIQTSKPGYPMTEKADSKIAEEEKGISKDTKAPDSKIAENEKLDSRKTSSKGNWQKYEKKRSAKGVFLRTNDEITKKFKQFCIANDWDFSQGTELAWNKLMNDLDIQTGSNSDSLIAQDDRRLKMMFKTKVFIINLYLRYNSIFNELAAADGKKWNARWSPRDDEAALRYNDLPPAIVELGILQTQIQKGIRTSRIQTFKYYTDEIEKVLASGISDEMLETILNYHRQIWKNQTGREIDLGFLTQSE